MYDDIVARFRAVLPPESSGDSFVSLCIVDEQMDQLSLRSGVLEPPSSRQDVGVMVTVHRNGGQGYAATSDLGSAGLKRAIEQASDWAEHGPEHLRCAHNFMPVPTGTYQTPWSAPG